MGAKTKVLRLYFFQCIYIYIFHSLYFELRIELCCILGLKEMSVNSMDNVLAENYFSVFLQIFFLTVHLIEPDVD